MSFIQNFDVSIFCIFLRDFFYRKPNIEKNPHRRLVLTFDRVNFSIFWKLRNHETFYTQLFQKQPILKLQTTD